MQIPALWMAQFFRLLMHTGDFLSADEPLAPDISVQTKNDVWLSANINYPLD